MENIKKSFRTYKMSEYCKKISNPPVSFSENIISQNPISDLSDPSRPKVPINVSYGDPSLYKDFQPHPKDLEYLREGVGKYDGYVEFSGIPETKRFLKDFYTSRGNFVLDESDIYITYGSSLAIWLAINVLAEKGNNILVPIPGFALAKGMALPQNIGVKEYMLNPNKKWEIDLEDLEYHIDENTKAIVVINPSNPTGSVFSKEHIENIIKIAEKHQLPIISDEIYEDMVFPGIKFVSFAEVSTNVPILLCSGLTKKQFAPGWRTGWLILNGPKGVFDNIKKGLDNLMTIFMNSNTISMQNIQKIIEKDNKFLSDRMEILKKRWEILKFNLKGVDCYDVLETQGTFYVVILVDLKKFQGINDTTDFCINIYKSFNVFCFPAECFGGKNFIRVVICSDEEAIKEFCNRMKEFYLSHKKM